MTVVEIADTRTEGGGAYFPRPNLFDHVLIQTYTHCMHRSGISRLVCIYTLHEHA